MIDVATRDKLLKLKEQIDRLSPQARLLMCSQLYKKDPEMAIVYGQRSLVSSAFRHARNWSRWNS